ncbi:MAG: hypothetical protein WD757_03400 [Actinomycetota bacterium]
MMGRRVVLGAGVLLVAFVLLAPPAGAHPLGNFTVNTFTRISVAPGEARVLYVVDMAEVPTLQERPRIDSNGDGAIAAAERSGWAAQTAFELASGLDLEIGGRPAGLDVSSSSMELGPGQAGLEVLRFEGEFTAAIPREGLIEYSDGNYRGRVGWREITANGVGGRALRGSTVPTGSVSDELRSYPDDLLESPLDVTEATFSFAPGAGESSSGPTSEAGQARPGVTESPFAGLVSGPAGAVALLLAFAFGAAHALAPGHGKTLMAAYLVGAGGRLRHAAIVASAVAVMHTASVLGLGLLVLSAQRLFAPEKVYPWLGLLSGIVVLGLGTWLLVVRSRAAGWRDGYSFARGLDRDQGSQDHGHGHDHAPPEPSSALLSRSGLAALAFSGGILPSPSALVVLLASVAVHRVGFGLALIGAFSIGLAASLMVVGVVAIRARDALANRVSPRLTALVPVGSASAIVLVGAALVVRAAVQL